MPVPIVVLAVGVLLIVAGLKGISRYAHHYYDTPRMAISIDLLLALLKGPGATFVVACLLLVVTGIILVYLAFRLGILLLFY